LGAQLIILKIPHLDRLGGALRGAGAATLAHGLVDLRDVLPVDLGHAVGTDAHAHQASGAVVRVHVGSDTANGLAGVRQKGPGPGGCGLGLGDGFADELGNTNFSAYPIITIMANF